MDDRGIAFVGFWDYHKIQLQHAIEAALGVDLQGYVEDFIVEDELRRLDDQANDWHSKSLFDYEDYHRCMHNCPPNYYFIVYMYVYFKLKES